MKYSIIFMLFVAVTVLSSRAEAQPVNQYNDRYQDHRYLPSATTNTQGKAKQNVSGDVVVSSPTAQGHPLTEEEMRNAKPMGMYVDAPHGEIKPLPRGGNQPPPDVPQSAPSGGAQWQPSVAPGAAEGYSDGGR